MGRGGGGGGGGGGHRAIRGVEVVALNLPDDMPAMSTIAIAAVAKAAKKKKETRVRNGDGDGSGECADGKSVLSTSG